LNWKQAIGAVAVVLAVAAAGWFGASLILGPPRPAAPAVQPKLFANWAAIVVAGDWRAQNGNPSKVFDNGRHDIAEKLVGMGFSRDNMLQFSAQAGHGVRARVSGQEVTVGRPGATVTIDGAVAGAIEISDTIKPEAAGAVRRLRAMGIEVWMITGDRATTANAVAREAGIDRVLADVLPAGKVEEIRKLQAAGRRVAMVGDGVNDAPALAQADLGIAMGRGTDVAMEASGVTLMRDNLNGVVEALELSRRTMRIIRQNLFWAFAYNVIGIPVAALGLLSPMLASAAMALSSVTVVTNSLRLK